MKMKSYPRHLGTFGDPKTIGFSLNNINIDPKEILTEEDYNFKSFDETAKKCSICGILSEQGDGMSCVSCTKVNEKYLNGIGANEVIEIQLDMAKIRASTLYKIYALITKDNFEF